MNEWINELMNEIMTRRGAARCAPHAGPAVVFLVVGLGPPPGGAGRKYMYPSFTFWGFRAQVFRFLLVLGFRILGFRGLTKW